MIRSREGKISWRTVIEHFNRFMDEEAQAGLNIQRVAIPWMELCVMGESENDGSFKAVHRIPVSSLEGED